MAGLAVALLASCNAVNPAASDDSSSVMGVINGISQQDKTQIPNRSYWLSCDGQNPIRGTVLDESQATSASVKFTDASLANSNGRRCHVEIKGDVNSSYQWQAVLQQGGAAIPGIYFASTNSTIQNQQFNANLYRTYRALNQGPTFIGLVYVQFPSAISGLNMNNARASLWCNGVAQDTTTSIQNQATVANGNPQNALLRFEALAVSKYTGMTCNDVIVSSDGGEWRFTTQRNYSFGTPVASALTPTKDGVDSQTYAYSLKNVATGALGGPDVQVNTTFVGDCAGQFVINTTGQQCIQGGTPAD